jgi:hypothetical protein
MQLIRFKTQLPQLVNQYLRTQHNDNLEIEVTLG